MTRILHIDASARHDGSVSRALSARTVEHLRTPDAVVVRRDLSRGLPFIDAAWVAAAFTQEASRNAAQRATLALSDTLVDELHAADIVVIGTPIYNFAPPAALKAWIDLVARAGRTFRYTDQGPVGLVEDTRAIVAIASGGTRIGSEIDFASGYLRHVLGFIGIRDVALVTRDTADAVLPELRAA